MREAARRPIDGETKRRLLDVCQDCVRLDTQAPHDGASRRPRCAQTARTAWSAGCTGLAPTSIYSGTGAAVVDRRGRGTRGHGCDCGTRGHGCDRGTRGHGCDRGRGQGRGATADPGSRAHRRTGAAAAKRKYSTRWRLTARARHPESRRADRLGGGAARPRSKETSQRLHDVCCQERKGLCPGLLALGLHTCAMPGTVPSRTESPRQAKSRTYGESTGGTRTHISLYHSRTAAIDGSDN